MALRGKRNGGQGPASIQDVAREAGVAASTVSRALTMPGRITEETREKVVAAATRLGYTPNAAARNLRRGRSKVVLIVLPGPFNAGASQIIGEMLTAIDKYFAAVGYSMVIANVDRQADSDRYMLDLAFSGQIDGAIIISSGVPEAGGRSMADSGVPIVATLFDCARQGVTSVITNDRQVSSQVITELHDLGHRHFLYVGGPRGNYVEIERWKGVRLALKGKAGVTLDHINGDFHFGSGTVAADRWLATGTGRPSAVFCASDDMAIGFQRRVCESGVRIPDEVSVVGFDGSSIGSYTIPSLSSVRQPTTLIGEEAVRAIVNLMERREDVPKRIVVPSELVMRESVGRAPAG